MVEATAARATKAPKGVGLAIWARRLRAIHLYLGALFAPALLFFAFSGALQEFSLHEAGPGSTYSPPAWIVRLAQVHKHQTLAMPPAKHPKAAAARKPGAHDERPQPSAPAPVKLRTWFARGFFAAAGAGLIVSTLIGVYLAFRFTRRPRVVGALIVLGLVAPLVLLLG